MIRSQAITMSVKANTFQAMMTRKSGSPTVEVRKKATIPKTSEIIKRRDASNGSRNFSISPVLNNKVQKDLQAVSWLLGGRAFPGVAIWSSKIGEFSRLSYRRAYP